MIGGCFLVGEKEGDGMDKKITSIELTNTSHMLSDGSSIGEHHLRLERAGTIVHSLYTGRKDKPAERDTYEADPNAMESFFLLFTDIQAQWKDDNEVVVMDGWSWECLIRHADGSIRKVTGTVNPPPYGKSLGTSIRKLADFKVKPWIFP
jgi:hypothetical protein